MYDLEELAYAIAKGMLNVIDAKHVRPDQRDLIFREATHIVVNYARGSVDLSTARCAAETGVNKALPPSADAGG